MDRQTVVVAEGKHLRMLRRGEWEYVERTIARGVVAILAITEEGNLLLTEQYRPPLGATTLELPAGLVGDRPGGESEEPSAAARRELLEETGYQATEVRFLTEGPSSSGLTNEVIAFYEAKGLKRVSNGGGEGSERIRVREAPLAGIRAWLEKRRESGVYVDPKIYAGLYLTRNE